MKVLCGYLISDDFFESEGAVMVEVEKLSQVEKAFESKMISMNHKKLFAPRKVDGWFMSWYLPEYWAFGKLKVVANAEAKDDCRSNYIRQTKAF
jgi:hypothetical protein